MLQVSPFTNVLPLQNFPTYVRHHIHKLPNVDAHNEKADTMIKIALLAHVEILEAENVRLKEKVQVIIRNTYVLIVFKMTNLYDLFTLDLLYLHFFNFLGPAVGHLNYWKSREGK